MAFFSRGFRAVCVFRGEMFVFTLLDDAFDLDSREVPEINQQGDAVARCV